MTIRNKAVDEAFRIIRDGIQKSTRRIKNPSIHKDLKQLYKLKLRILVDIQYEFDDYLTQQEPVVKTFHDKDIFPNFINREIGVYEECIDSNGERLILNTLHTFRIELMKRLIEKYQKMV
jgi:hypothetical protein